MPKQPQRTGKDTDAPKLVIFDFDGVLVDSEVISLSTLRATLRAFGAPLSDTEVRDRFLGSSIRQITAFLDTVAAPAFPAAEFEARWYATLFDRFRRDLAPMPGALALLDHLDVTGRAFCIASGSAMERLGVALDATGLAARFGDRVYSADIVQRGKPAPDIFLHAAREMGFEPSRCMVIEDSPAGATAARAAGMQSLGFVGGAHLRGQEDAHREILLSLQVDAVLDDLGAVRDFL